MWKILSFSCKFSLFFNEANASYNNEPLWHMNLEKMLSVELVMGLCGTDIVMKTNNFLVTMYIQWMHVDV
jgi:hypothetical protein